jgi:16S rRNA (guanine1207-N2)-methyltransferase
MISETQFETPFGQFELQRRPRRAQEKLRPWDAADEYLLKTVAEEYSGFNRPLICNDSFGALSVALHRQQPVNWSDSYIAQQAVRDNLLTNKLEAACVEFLGSLSLPPSSPELVLVKVPKTLALLEDQLIRLKPLLTDSSRVLIAGMVKSMPSSVWKMVERVIGPTQTRRAVKKAKIIQVTVDPALGLPVNPYPTSWTLEETSLIFVNHANVFSREKLDIGARFLMENLPQTEGEGDIIDLGCGNGVLGIMAARQNPQAIMHFVDESYMAIASATQNYEQSGLDTGQASFHVSDGLSDFEDACSDLVLCNPPFHQQQAVDDGAALNLFSQAARVLRPGAELWVIGNRHLGYHKKLKKWFKPVELMASNNKFVVLKATKTEL